MRVSRRAEYAVKAVLDLALHAPSTRGARSIEVARRTERAGEVSRGDPARSARGRLRLEQARAGRRALAGARPGASHGQRHRGGDRRSLVDRTGKPRGRITPEEACVRSLWARVEAALMGVLRAVTLDDLRQQAGAPEALDFTI